MANISETQGMIRLCGAWDQGSIGMLNTILKTVERWDYGFSLADELSESLLESSFKGAGRWTFRTNLDNIHGWLTDGRYAAPPCTYKELLDVMERENLVISIAYEDKEPGMGVDVKTFGLLLSKDGELVYCSEMDCEGAVHNIEGLLSSATYRLVNYVHGQIEMFSDAEVEDDLRQYGVPADAIKDIGTKIAKIYVDLETLKEEMEKMAS